MATGRIGVTPTLRTRWSKAPSGGTTSLSGLDDNSVSLVYDVGYEAVYRNGVLLSRTNDYTATSGTSITLIDATITGDIIEVFANQLVPLTDAISKGQYSAKAALLSASAASTPAVLTVGSNDQVLTADSSTATGLKWATPSSGGMTLLSTTTLSGASTDISSISQDYKQLKVYVYGITASVNPIAYVVRTFNGATELTSATGWRMSNYSTPAYTAGAAFRLTSDDSGNQNVDGSSSNNFWSLIYDDYSSTTNYKSGYYLGNYVNTSAANVIWNSLVGITSNSAINKLRFEITSGTFSAGTVEVYGVK